MGGKPMLKALYNFGKGKKGFTLIELLIVVAIIAILAAIAIPQFAAYRKRGYNASANSDLRNLRTTEEAMYADFRITAGQTLQLLTQLPPVLSAQEPHSISRVLRLLPSPSRSLFLQMHMLTPEPLPLLRAPRAQVIMLPLVMEQGTLCMVQKTIPLPFTVETTRLMAPMFQLIFQVPRRTCRLLGLIPGPRAVGLHCNKQYISLGMLQEVAPAAFFYYGYDTFSCAFFTFRFFYLSEKRGMEK